MLQVFLSTHSQKLLKKIDPQLYQRLRLKIKSLAEEPFPTDSKRIVGRKDKVFRVRVGDYRILYLVDGDKNELIIANIDKRSKIYN